MTPSISYRIDSLIQAMSDIVLPAIDTDKGLAREQAQLIVAHLQLMKRQLPQALAFDALELQAASKLAHRLLELEPAIAGLAEHRQAVEAALSAAPGLADPQDAIRQVNHASEALVRALRAHAPRAAIDAMTAAVLEHTRDQSLRNRIWFASNGFDSERDRLPPIEFLLTAGN